MSAARPSSRHGNWMKAASGNTCQTGRATGTMASTITSEAAKKNSTCPLPLTPFHNEQVTPTIANVAAASPNWSDISSFKPSPAYP